ncbi:MAG: HEAT repeat domain-containing protein [Spirochaetota bacterium]
MYDMLQTAKYSVLLFLLAFIPLTGVAQDSDDLETYLETFESGNVDTKLGVLERVGEEPTEEVAPLYLEAARYLENNAGQIENSSALVEMTELTARGVREAGSVEALNSLRRIFENYTAPEARSTILATLGELGGEDEDTIRWLTDFLEDQNSLQSDSAQPNTEVVRAAIEAAADISDQRFFEPLLDAALAGYSSEISQEAAEAVHELEGDIVQLAARSIGNRSPEAKRRVLEFFLDADELSDEQKAAVGAAAVRDAITTETEGRDAQEALRDVRFMGAEVISEHEYSDAADAMIEHFNESVLEYDRGQLVRSRVLDAIEGLGDMGVEAAAERLSRFLELLNRYTENDRPYDTRIVMATIENLEKLGHPVAYNPLFYTSVLEAYPKRVQDAAGEAMDSVQ